MKVLVVDDNVDAADLLAEALEVLGHEAKAVHDGQIALDAAARSSPDVVILDIGLPGLDGHEVARRLRAIPGLDATTLVALTGYADDASRDQSRDAGFAHHLVKPVDLAALQRVLDEIRRG